MSYNSVLEKQIKPFGKWQLYVFVLFYIANSLSFIDILRLPNIGPNHVCASPWFRQFNLTYAQVLNVSKSIQQAVNASKDLDFSCVRYPAWVYKYFEGNRDDFDTDVFKQNISMETCRVGEWLYDESSGVLKHSLVQSFDLVCDRQYFIPMTPVLNLIASFIGMMGASVLSDRYGRKRLASIVTPITSILLISLYFCNYYPLMVTAFFFLGMFSPVAYNTGYILCLEVTDAATRNTFSAIDGVWLFIIGDGSITALAYFTQDWRWMCLGIGLICSVSFFYICLLPESPKWLIAKGRYEEALAVIRSAILINGNTPSRKDRANNLKIEDIQLIDEVCDSRSDDNGPSNISEEILGILKSYRELLTRGDLCQLWIPLSAVWFFLTICTTGTSFYAVRLSGNAYLIAMATALIRVPSKLLQWVLYRFFDRKRPIFVLFAISSLICMSAFAVSLFFPDHIAIVIMVNLVIGLSSSLYGMLQLYSSEVFPTLYRNNAVGLLYGISNLGSSVGMFVERLDLYVWHNLPLLVFGVILALCLMFYPFLPKDSSDVTINQTDDRGSYNSVRKCEDNEADV